MGAPLDCELRTDCASGSALSQAASPLAPFPDMPPAPTPRGSPVSPSSKRRLSCCRMFRYSLSLLSHKIYCRAANELPTEGVCASAAHWRGATLSHPAPTAEFFAERVSRPNRIRKRQDCRTPEAGAVRRVLITVSP